MSVTTTGSRIAYNGDGVTTAFTFPFPFLDNNDIKPFLNGSETAETTGFSVVGEGTGTGTVTFLTPPAAGVGNVILVRVPDFLQQTKFPTNNRFPSDSVEAGLDKAMIGLQYLLDSKERSLRLSDGDPSAIGPLPESDMRANKLLSFDAQGNPTAVVPDAQSAVALQIELADASGSALIGFRQSGSSLTRTVQSVLRETLRANDFPGVDPTGLTDSTTGIRAAVAELVSRGRGSIDFNGTYLLASTAGLGSLFTFLNMRGIEVHGNGSLLVVNTSRIPTASEGTIFRFDNSKNIVVDGFETDGPVVDITQTAVKGYEFVRCVNGCDGVSMPNNRVRNLLAGFIASKTFGDPDSMRTRNINIGNLYVEHAWYGANLQHSGDNCEIANLRTDTIHRSLFIYGMRGLEARVRSKDPWSWDVNLSTFSGSTLEDIGIHYLHGADTQNAGDADKIILMAADAVAGVMRDIRINVDITYAPTGNTGASAVRFSKLNNSGAFDLVDRGHTREDIRISGRIIGVPKVPDGGPVSLDNLCSWGENMRNISFDGLSAPDHTQRCYWPQGGFQTSPGLSLRNSNLASPLALQPGGLSDAFTVPVRMDNSIVANSWTTVASQRPVEILPVDSSVTIPAGYSGKKVSNRGATGTVTHTLPPALVGREFTFVREAEFIYRIDPDPSDNFRESSAGKYLQMNATGNVVHIKAVVAGVWEVVSARGAITFEP